MWYNFFCIYLQIKFTQCFTGKVISKVYQYGILSHKVKKPCICDSIAQGTSRENKKKGEKKSSTRFHLAALRVPFQSQFAHQTDIFEEVTLDII